MTRNPRRVACAAVVTVVMSSVLNGGQTSAQTIVGRLAIVEPSAARITVVVAGEVDLKAMAVARDAEIRQGERRLTLSELVIEVGRRVTITYRDEQGQPVATSINVEPEQSATPLAAAIPPTPPR